jgi:hypothetical protein
VASQARGQACNVHDDCFFGCCCSLVCWFLSRFVARDEPYRALIISIDLRHVSQTRRGDEQPRCESHRGRHEARQRLPFEGARW